MHAGKITRGVDGSGTPHTTAARELEEESHGLIPAAATTALLPQCPVFYCSESKMAIYLMRYAGGEGLPQLLEQRLAGGDVRRVCVCVFVCACATRVAVVYLHESVCAALCCVLQE